MNRVLTDLLERVPEILAEWKRVSSEEPWLSRPQEDRIEGVPTLVASLLNSALAEEEGDISRHREMVRAAATLGETRCAQGIPQETLFSEYHLLREALWRCLERTGAELSERAHAILHVDAAISLATRASLYGYHRGELDAMGRWPQVLEDVLDESMLVAPRAQGTPAASQLG
jgi:hypothetical protein